ncbi:probable disease resistance protein At4g27220 isoform X2 [Cajanus cajan]|uniref:probable disease resistance protein At4g27220 isoform X2 n=1 Tax=Cajanus cajan TaxID=3821 RepID=UPI0010FB3AB0|nr:probable disease resistance protein At4g27220 isoform X2 [Cajanus cajan]
MNSFISGLCHFKMEICLSIAAKIAEYTVGSIIHHGRYLCCFHNFVGNLPIAKEELELTRDSVKERVRQATNRTEKIEPSVEKWLKDVEKVLEEVQLLEGRILEASKIYFRRRCQYFLAKEIARKLEIMTQLNRNSRFEPFSSITELPGMKYYSSKDFVYFSSTKSTYNKLLEALKDESVCMIGLFGMGGSGKTSLAKEVGKKVEELKLFEEVVMATISQTPNIRGIQAQIADKLCLEFKEESEEGRAQRLSKRIRERTTLVILDDVWEKLDFEAIGIPFNNENSKGCRVLLTTRKREVCMSMQCQSIIELDLLTDEESWTLFKKYANLTDDSLDVLKDVARKIADECKGLPIAIVTVGSTLKGKTFQEWKSALSRLEDSIPLDIPDGLRTTHACLKLSYDNLKNELAKSLLLLCSIFPEDHEIDLEDLFRFGRGLGLNGIFGTMEKARIEIHVAVNILRDSCLLLRANKKEKVKMHDMVRDVALWIASEKGQAILASNTMDPSKLVEDETIKDKKAISLWDLENGLLLNDQLNCPTTEIILLHSQRVGFEVSNACLERSKMLKILALLQFGYKCYFFSFGFFSLSLPQSMKALKNLRTLCLRGFELGDISILESLQALEILDLRGSYLEELPNGIVALKNLRLLDLYGCLVKKNNSYKVIRECLQLEELYLWLVSPQEDFPHDVSFFCRLRKYVVVHNYTDILSQLLYYLEEHRPSRALCIDGFNAPAQSFISLPINDLFVRANILCLSNLEGGYKNVIPSMDSQGMNQLILLMLSRCRDIECLFESTITTDTNVYMLQTEVVFSSLVIIYLYFLDSLYKVFHDRCSLKNLEELYISHCPQLYNISFPRNSKLCNLKELRIDSCPMLASLFMPSIIQTLVLLEHLEISGCSELKHIIEEGDVDYFRNQNHTSWTLPKLRYLNVDNCHRLEYIFHACFSTGLASLENLVIINNCNLKYVFGSEREHHASVNQHQSSHQTDIDINLIDLDYLELSNLPNLIDIWPDYYHSRLPNTKRLQCFACPKLFDSTVRKLANDSALHRDTTTMEKEILWPITIGFNQLRDQMFSFELKVVFLDCIGIKGVFQFQIEEPRSNIELVPLNMDLEHISLTDLLELNFIWKGPTNFLSLQVLQYFYLSACPKLKTIFSPTIVRSFPVLTDLRIFDCEKLEQIFDLGDAQEQKVLHTCSQKVCFPKLKNIEVQKCNKLRCLFYNFVASDFPILTTLEIKECSQLDKAFAFERETDDDGQEGEHVLLQNLRDIKLASLPNFKDIHQEFKLKDDVNQTIKDCPKYSPSLYLYPGTTDR